MQRTKIILCALSGTVISIGCGTQSGPPVELFAANVISTELPEFSITFTPDGSRAFFNRTNSARTELHLWTVAVTADGFGQPQPVSFSTRDRYIDPFIVADGSLMLLSSNRPVSEGRTDFNTWAVPLTETGWEAPFRFAEALDSESDEIFISATADHTVVFRSQRDGTPRVWTSTFEDGAWSEPTPLLFGSVEAFGNPMISRDGSMIAGVLEYDDGDSDLAVSCHSGGAWSEPDVLPDPVNSDFADFAPSWGPHGEYLYFTSERPGMVEDFPEGQRRPGDIYRVALADLSICESSR